MRRQRSRSGPECWCANCGNGRANRLKRGDCRRRDAGERRSVPAFAPVEIYRHGAIIRCTAEGERTRGGSRPSSSRSDRDRELRRQLFTIVMFTPLISPFELICTVCLLPLVCKVRLAANPAAWTNTSIRPPPAVPCRLPFTLRLDSL